MQIIEIIIPIYNEESVVAELISRLNEATIGLNYIINYILVDDGSRDNTLSILRSLQQTEKRLKIIQLSRNWGQQNAYNAGIENSCGDAVILMDGDLEDPPELIPKFIQKWEEGFDVVYGVKDSRQRSFFGKCMFSLFHKIFGLVSDIPVDRHSGAFSLVNKRVIDELKKCREKNKYYAGLRSFVGFKQARVNYHREMRFAGNPKQTFKKLLNDALNAFFSFSFLPIRLVTFFGIILLAFISMISILLIIAKVTTFQHGFFFDLPGWTSVVLLILFVIGVQIVFTGILGEYIARIFDEVRNRPYYIVDNIYEPKEK